VDSSLKALDPERPIREADSCTASITSSARESGFFWVDHELNLVSY